MEYFLKQQLIILYFDKWGSDELKELYFYEALKVLEDEKYWNAPAINESCIKVGNTVKGEKFYNEELVSDFM